MTKEQREKLVKSAKSSCEKAKVNIRRVRQNCMNDLKKLKSTSEDEVYETKDKVMIIGSHQYRNYFRECLFRTRMDSKRDVFY